MVGSDTIRDRLLKVCCPDCTDGDACGNCQTIYDAHRDMVNLTRERDEARAWRNLCVIEVMQGNLHVNDYITRADGERDRLRALLREWRHVGLDNLTLTPDLLDRTKAALEGRKEGRDG